MKREQIVDALNDLETSEAALNAHDAEPVRSTGPMVAIGLEQGTHVRKRRRLQAAVEADRSSVVATIRSYFPELREIQKVVDGKT